MKILPLTIALFAFACQPNDYEARNRNTFQKRPVKHEPSIIKAAVQYVDFSILTYVGTSCERFDKQFPRATKVEIINKNVLASLARSLSRLKPDTATFSMDTRAKVTIYYDDNSVSILCLDRFNMLLNGNKVTYDKSINNLLGITTK